MNGCSNLRKRPKGLYVVAQVHYTTHIILKPLEDSSVKDNSTIITQASRLAPPLKDSVCVSVWST